MDAGKGTDLDARFNLPSSEKDAASGVSIKNMPMHILGEEYMLGFLCACLMISFEIVCACASS